VYQIRLRSGAVGSGIPSPAGSTAGDLLVRGASGWSRLAIGTAGQVLSVVGSAIGWAAGGGGGGISDGDKGDVTVSASGTVWTVDAIGGVAAARVARTDSGWSNTAGVYSHALSVGGAMTQAGGDGVLVVEAGGTSVDILSVGNTGASLVSSATAADALVILGTAALYQPLDADLTAIAALGGTGLARRTGASTWSVGTQVATGEIADDAVTYPKIQEVTATDRLLGRSTAGAGVVEEIACTSAGRALLDDADASAQRTTLGLAAIAASGSATDLTTGTVPSVRLGASPTATKSLRGDQTWVEDWTTIVMGSDATDSTASLVDCGTLSFTPVGGALYEIEALLVFETAATTTGCQWTFVDSATSTWSAQWLFAPTNATANANRNGALNNVALGTGTGASTRHIAFGKAMVQAQAVPTGVIKVQIRTEVAASLLTVRAGSFMRYRRLT
jgi:hypothetical protein